MALPSNISQGDRGATPFLGQQSATRPTVTTKTTLFSGLSTRIELWARRFSAVRAISQIGLSAAQARASEAGVGFVTRWDRATRPAPTLRPLRVCDKPLNRASHSV